MNLYWTAITHCLSTVITPSKVLFNSRNDCVSVHFLLYASLPVLLFLLVDASCCERLGERFESFLRVCFSSWGSFCVLHPCIVLLGSCILVAASSGGLFYMRITTDPVDLWSSPSSQARQEREYFDSHFGPFFRTAQLIITSPLNDTFIYSPYFGGSDVPFKAILSKEILHEVSDVGKHRTNCLYYQITYEVCRVAASLNLWFAISLFCFYNITKTRC